MNIENNKISCLKKKKKERKHLYAIEDSEQSNLFNMTSAEGKKIYKLGAAWYFQRI